MMDIKNLEIQNFSIVLVAVNQNPSILNPDFLKYNHIVPVEWELGMPPISIPPLSQVAYKNGFNIIAQEDRITFLQSDNKLLAEVSEVSFKYVDTLGYLNYQAIGINFSGYVIFDKAEKSYDFILEKLIAPGAWKSFQGSSPSVAIQFVYPLSDANLNVTVQAGNMEDSSNNIVTRVLLFSANFHRDLVNIVDEERILEAKRIIQSWETDFNTFHSLVEDTFLGGLKE
ncbi:MAG: hypothetical protein AB1589_07430 [Cyanobacteriota bacterium]